MGDLGHLGNRRWVKAEKDFAINPVACAKVEVRDRLATTELISQHLTTQLDFDPDKVVGWISVGIIAIGSAFLVPKIRVGKAAPTGAASMEEISE